VRTWTWRAAALQGIRRADYGDPEVAHGNQGPSEIHRVAEVEIWGGRLSWNAALMVPAIIGANDFALVEEDEIRKVSTDFPVGRILQKGVRRAPQFRFLECSCRKVRSCSGEQAEAAQPEIAQAAFGAVGKTVWRVPGRWFRQSLQLF